jgi:hypothetical protein
MMILVQIQQNMFLVLIVQLDSFKIVQVNLSVFFVVLENSTQELGVLLNMTAKYVTHVLQVVFVSIVVVVWDQMETSTQIHPVSVINVLWENTKMY